MGNLPVLHLSVQFSVCFFCVCLFTTYLFKLNPFGTIKTWGIFFLGLSITESEKRAEMLTYTIVLRNLLDRNFIHISLLPGINANISLTLQIKVFGTLYTNRIHQREMSVLMRVPKWQTFIWTQRFHFRVLVDYIGDGLLKCIFSFRYTFICGFYLMSLNFTNVANWMTLFGLLLQYILWNMDEYGFFFNFCFVTLKHINLFKWILKNHFFSC